MIKFFRHIRQKLLSENKFSRYLLYATGEIILVVIGILIALQINNWNDLKKERQIERQYLEALRSEFVANLEKLDASITSCNTLAAQLGTLLTYFEPKKSDTINSATIARNFGEALRYQINFNPNTGVQKDLISSGNLRQIRNAVLRQKIASFDTALGEIEKQESGAIDVKDDIGKTIIKLVSMRPIFESGGSEVLGNSKFEEVDVKLVFNNMEVENNLILYQAITKSTGLVYYTPLKKDIEGIIALIDSELGN
ncbi:MAG: DUF6090 family protein [Bacteroidota bacterium]